VSKDIDPVNEHRKAEGQDKGRATIEGISHYAVEAAILKVFGSEVLDYVVDEAVQIHGGMGYSAEMSVERGYRDSRINRIFEGTNEINRLLVVDTAMKRAMKGDFNLFCKADELMTHLGDITEKESSDETYFDGKMKILKNCKKAILITLQGANKTFGRTLVQEQEVLNNISDMIIDLYIAESTAMRIKKIEILKGQEASFMYKNILDVLIFNSTERIRKAGLDAIYSFANGEQAVRLACALGNLTELIPCNVKELRRRIADKLIEENDYKF